jgi:O-antigen/teichoic acid export membrane protein
MEDSKSHSTFGRTTIHGTAWRYLAFISGKLLVFVSTVILARLLTPDDFGVVGYAVTAITFLDIVNDLGVGPALIYHDEDERTSTTAFWLSLSFGIALLGIGWVLAPYAGAYFRDPRVIPVTRALSFTFPINALGGIQASVLYKKLSFGKMLIPDLLMAFTKGIVSIGLAMLGLGAWSLIWGQISGTLVSSAVYWIITPWHPNFAFDTKVARGLISYGLNIVWVDLLSEVLLNLDYILVGRYLGSVELGLYTLAFRMPDLMILQFSRVLGQVVFPVFTHMRDVPGNLARAFSQVLRYVSLVTIPLGIGLSLVAAPLVITLFTSKWEGAIPVVQAIALYAMLLSLVYNAGDAYKAEGRPQVIVWLGLVRLGLLFPALWWAVTGAGSIVAVGWMQALVAFLGAGLELYVASRLLHLSIATVLDAVRPAALAGLLMAVFVKAVLYLTAADPAWQQLLLGIASGGVIYILALWILERGVVLDVVRMMRSAVARAA